MKTNPFLERTSPSANRALKINLAILTLVMTIIAAVFYHQAVRVSQSRQWLLHSYEVRYQIQAVYGGVKEAEAAQRGYLLTGNPVFLSTYETLAHSQTSSQGDSVHPIQQELQALRTLISDNPAQQPNLQLLDSLVRRRIQSADSNIRLFQEKGTLASGEEVNSMKGTTLTAQIREATLGMLSQEAALFKKRHDAERTYWTANNILVGSGVLAVYFSFLLIVFLGGRNRKRQLLTERQVHWQENLLSALMDGGKHGIITTNRNREITAFNYASEQIFGYPASHFLGKSISELINTVYPLAELEDEAQKLGRELGRPVGVREVFMAGVQKYGTYEKEWTIISGDGKKKSMLLSLTPMKDENGQANGNIAIYQDISERKELDRIKSEFVSTVSHELRTPLTSIRGVLGLITMEGMTPEKSRELVSIAYRNTERLVLLVNDILDIEKIDSESFSPRILSVNVAEMLRQSVEINQAYAHKYNVRLVQNPVDATVSVRADPDRLMQVFVNLLSNAAKYSPPGSNELLDAQCREGRVHFKVQDFGPGIPEDFRTKIFEKFARADSSNTRKHEGTGLGLNIARKLVQAMHGSIDFETELGKGTTFFFDLPEARAKDRS